MARFPNPTGYTGQKATEDKHGVMKFANSVEAADSSNDQVALSPKQLQNAPSATTSLAGVLETSTDAEAVAKIATDKIVTPSNLASSGFLQWADVTITAAQIKLLATTPIELVAAPSAGSMHMFMGAVFKLNYGGSNVFTESGDNLGIKYTNASGVQVSSTVETTAWIDQTADTITNSVAVLDAIVVATGAEAQALVLDNLNANIAGNAANDNTVTVRTYYVTQAL